MNLKSVSNYVAITLLATPVVWFYSNLWAQVLRKSSLDMWPCIVITTFLVTPCILYKGKNHE